MDIKMVKRFFPQVNAPPSKKLIQNKRIIGMINSIGYSNSPHCLLPIEGVQALSFISNLIVVIRCVNGSLFEVHQSKHGYCFLTAHI